MVSPAVDSPTPLLQRLSPRLVPELKRYLAAHVGEVEALIASGGTESGELAGRRLAKVFDGLLGSLYHGLRASLYAGGAWRRATLGAVGSYGRGAVALRSDLDVRFLCHGPIEAAESLVEALLYPLWDAGLSLGHQVLTVEDLVELARRDLPTATSILDWRVIAGDDEHEGDVLERVFDGLFGAGVIGAFLDQLGAGVEDRLERYGGSVYLLEPDVKNGPGGLRDLDVAHWAARARWRVRGFRDLVRLGVLVPREWQQIAQASDFMWRVRNLLHFHAGRRLDRLSFERQEQLARDLGYGLGEAAVERFMSEYYRQARTVTRSRDMILGRAAPAPVRRLRSVSLGHGLKVTQGAMSIDDPGALETEPALAVRLFDAAVRQNLAVYPFARDAVMRATSSPSFCERLRTSEEAAQLFTRLVTVTTSTRFKHGSLMHELHDVGLLVAMIPEFLPVVGRAHHDVYHVYTVDAHSVAAVERLAMLCRGELTAEFPLASRLAAEIARPAVLFFATLLHDVGKDIGGIHHSQRGFHLVRDILARLRFTEEDIAEVQHLVLEHLTMYHVATRRDVDDPHTVEAFCKKVRGREGLRELYLLTVCDVSTTSPTAMNSWKAKMLDELYVAADGALSQGAEARDRQRTERVRERVRAGWPLAERPFLEEFLAAMPERYFYANDPKAIDQHARFARDAEGAECLVRVLASEPPYLEIGFIADDRPGLLALVTATLAAARLAVMNAQIYSRSDGGRVRALDVFWVKGGARSAPADELGRRLERNLSRLLSGEADPAQLVGSFGGPVGRSDRPTPQVRTEIAIDNRAASEHTVLEVATRDRVGLLFRLATAIQKEGLTISLAKINTEGDRVADVFYVLDDEGAKLTSAERVDRLKEHIRGAIEELENGRSGA